MVIQFSSFITYFNRNGGNFVVHIQEIPRKWIFEMEMYTVDFIYLHYNSGVEIDSTTVGTNLVVVGPVR